MAGRNKRLAISFLAEMQRALLQMLRELQEERDKEELHARGLQGVADDIAGATTQILMNETAAWRTWPDAARPFCRLEVSPLGYPCRATGRIEWRGNCVSIGVAIDSLIGGRRQVIRNFSRSAARTLGPMPCRHVGEKRRLPCEPKFRAFASFSAGMAAADALMAIEVYIRCEDCGEEIGGR